MSVTLISRRLAALALVALLASPMAADAQAPSFASPQAAFETAMTALKAGDVEHALPGLEHSAAHGVFLAQFYLARVFSDNAGAYTDHAKAYMLYQRIADEHADIDPDDDQRAPFVAKSLTALAEYVRDGISEIGLESDPERATEYLRHAATFFNDPDAQFELAKLFLRPEAGDGASEDVKRAMHWLAVLTEKGHAPAQAFLADLYWEGKHIAVDKLRALALISVAVENAPASEQVWIDDIYQGIFCGSSVAARTAAASVVTDWRHKYGRHNDSLDYAGITPLGVSTARTCSNGEPVVMVRGPGGKVGSDPIATSAIRGPAPERSAAAAAQPAAQTGVAAASMMGVGLRRPETSTAAPAR